MNENTSHRIEAAFKDLKAHSVLFIRLSWKLERPPPSA